MSPFNTFFKNAIANAMEATRRAPKKSFVVLSETEKEKLTSCSWGRYWFKNNKQQLQNNNKNNSFVLKQERASIL